MLVLFIFLFLLFLIVSIIVLFIVLFFISLHSRQTDYTKDEPLNPDSYYHYKEQNYKVQGDGVIFDEQGLKITVTGFYAEEDSYTEEVFKEPFSRVRIGYRVDNYSGKNLTVSFRYVAINGIASNRFSIFYGHFKNNSSVTFYENMYDVRNGVIKEMILDNFKFSDREDYRYESSAKVKILTDSDYEYSDPVIEEPLLYDQNDIKVYFKEAETPDSFLLYIMNNSDYDYHINSSKLIIGEETDDTPVYRQSIPSHHTFLSGDIRIFPKKGGTLEDCKLSLSFSSFEDPSKDFSTGYLTLKKKP